MADEQTAKPQISLAKFRPLKKGTLLGIVDVTLPVVGNAVMLIKEMTLHRKDGRIWISMPAKPRLGANGVVQKDENGRVRYMELIEWTSREMGDRFSARVISLIQQSYPEALT